MSNTTKNKYFIVMLSSIGGSVLVTPKYLVFVCLEELLFSAVGLNGLTQLLLTWGGILDILFGHTMHSSKHRWELPVNYPVFTVVMVIYHYVERIWRILVTLNVFVYHIKS